MTVIGRGVRGEPSAQTVTCSDRPDEGTTRGSPAPGGRHRRTGDRGQPHRRAPQRRRDLPGHARGDRSGRAHRRPPHLRLLGRRDRHTTSPSGWPSERERGVRVRVLLDALGARTIDHPLRRPHGGGRRPGAVVPSAAPPSPDPVQPPDPPQGDDRRRGGRVHRRRRASPTSGRATPATSTSGATPTSGSGGRPSTGLRAAFLDNWTETDPEIFADDVDRFPDQPKPGIGDRAVRPQRVGARLGRGRHAVPDAAAAGRAARADHHRLLRARPTSSSTGSATPATEGWRSRSCCPGPTPTSGSCSWPASTATPELLDAGIEIWNFQPSMLHAKVMTVDGLVANIGSANLNRRSVALDEEVNLVALDRELTAEARRAVRRRPGQERADRAGSLVVEVGDPAGGRAADHPGSSVPVNTSPSTRSSSSPCLDHGTVLPTLVAIRPRA